MNKDEALRMALEAIEKERYSYCNYSEEDRSLEYIDEAIAVIQEALAQPEQEPTYKVTVVDDQHPAGIPLEQWTPEDMAYRPGGLPQSDPTPDQLAALGWQSIECPFCGTAGAQAFPKPETDWEGIAADQAMTIALMKSEQEPVARIGMIGEEHFADVCRKANGNSNTQLYTSPPKREWVGLTEKAAELVYEDVSGQSLRPQDYRLVLQFAIAIEAKLKEENT